MHRTNSEMQAMSGRVIAMALRRNPRLASGLKAKLLRYIVLSKDEDDKFYNMVSESKMILKSVTYECFGRCHY